MRNHPTFQIWLSSSREQEGLLYALLACFKVLATVVGRFMPSGSLIFGSWKHDSIMTTYHNHWDLLTTSVQCIKRRGTGARQNRGQTLCINIEIYTETPMRSIQIPRVPSWKDDSVYTLNVSGRFTPDFSRWQHLSCKLHKPWWFNSWLRKISWRSLGHSSQKKVTKNGQNRKLFQASKEDMPSIQNIVGVSDATGSIKNPPETLLPVLGVSVSQVWWFWSCSPRFSTQLQPQKPPDWSWNPSPHRWSFTWMSQEVSKWVITYL